MSRNNSEGGGILALAVLFILAIKALPIVGVAIIIFGKKENRGLGVLLTIIGIGVLAIMGS